MSDNKNKQLPLIQTPIENLMPEVTDPAQSSAGINAVASSMKYAFSEMGVTRAAQTLSKLNRFGGFDCPSCAWPDPDDRRALAEFCENGARAVADEATRKRVTPEFFAARSIDELSLMSDFEIGQQGRLTHPMIKRAGGTHYEPISWTSAFELIAKELSELDSPNEASFYTSGRTSNEAAFLYQLFVRLYGTNNLPDCSNMCHESSGFALNEQIGIGKGTVTLEDFNHADCIIVAGQNPGTNHPRMLTALENATRNGCRIISINPLKEAGLTSFKNPQQLRGWIGPGTPLASLFLPVRINGDVAAVKGILKELLSAEELNPGQVFDVDFIKSSTSGFDALIADLRVTSWDEIVSESGLSREQLAEAAKIIANAKRLIVCWAMGLTQHGNAVANIQYYMNLLLLGGHIGRKGAGACPVRGHSNVQGDRTMGIFEKMPDSFLDALDKEFGFRPPRAHGLDTVDTIRAMNNGKVKVFFALGGNFLAATPDTAYVAKGLSQCRLTVHVSTKLNRAHLITGEQALILPCLGRTEIDIQETGAQFVTVEDSMGVVRSSRGNLKPGSDFLKSEVAIVAGLAEALFRSDPEKHARVRWRELTTNYDFIREHISHVVSGFEDFNTRARRPEGFFLPNGPRDSRLFRTPNGKANFVVHPIAQTRREKGRFVMMTIRSHDQFNTTIYGLNDRYRGVTEGRRVVFMNADDMHELGFERGSLVDILSHFQDEIREAKQFFVVPYEIPRQCVATYFPEGNVLVPISHTAKSSNTPAYKSIEVSLQTVRLGEA